MHQLHITVMLLILQTQAYPQHPRPHKRGQLPLTVTSTEFLGDVHSSTTYVARDLGFAGQIGNYVLESYGDTLFANADYSTTPFRGMVSDSVALATHDPLTVLDVNLDEQGYPRQFFPLLPEYGEDPSTYALGITNVVETSPGVGVMYFLLNHRPNGTNTLLGAGVGVVTLSDTYPPIPSVQRLGPGQYWWDGAREPWFGDVGAVRHSDGYIYAYGHAKDVPWVYLARVRWQDATDLDCYEYWNGKGWQGERLVDVGEKEGVFWQVNQGQVVWSEYYAFFLFVYCDTWLNSKLLARTAPRPEGPWSDARTLYQATPATNGSSVYAAAPQAQFDPSGATLVVCFTSFPNVVQGVKVGFG